MGGYVKDRAMNEQQGPAEPTTKVTVPATIKIPALIAPVANVVKSGSLSFDQGSSLVRPALAMAAVLTLCIAVLLGNSPPTWFIVIANTIISFYFGHVNGKSETATAQAGNVAAAALAQAVEQRTPQ